MKTVKAEGFLPTLGKVLFLMLLCGLLLQLILVQAGIGTEWIFERFPILNAVRDVLPDVLYIFWPLSVWLGFKIGKHAGMKKGALREREKLGIPF